MSYSLYTLFYKNGVAVLIMSEIRLAVPHIHQRYKFEELNKNIFLRRVV